MKLTEQIIHSAGTNGIGFNFHQLYVLGVQWPPKHGWIHAIVGKDIPDEKWALVMSLKGKSRAERRQILSQTPFRKEIFTRKADLRGRIVELCLALDQCIDVLESVAELAPDFLDDKYGHFSKLTNEALKVARAAKCG